MTYTIHITPCPEENLFEWTVDNEAGLLMGAGYCATESDAQNDAEAFIRWLILN